MSTYSKSCWLYINQTIMTVKPTKRLGMNISWKSRFSTALTLAKKHLFIQTVDKTNSRKQTHSFHVRKEIKTTQFGNFPNAISISWCRWYVVFCYSEYSLLLMLPYIFYERYSSRLACYAFLVSINYLISKRKQHTFWTFALINKLQGKQ